MREYEKGDLVMFDLKSFREDNLKMTQVDFAEMIGTRQDTVSRWEKNTDQIPLEALRTIAGKCGVTIDQLTGYEKPQPAPLNLENTWRTADFTQKTFVDYIDRYMTGRKCAPGDKDYSFISELKKIVDKSISKPKVAIVGRSDVGKSALINSLIGIEKMPTSWTPTTSITVYIKHISDRPQYMEEDVWIFKTSLGEEQSWDDKRLQDEEYCRAWKLAGGSMDILRNYGTRQGEGFDKNDAGAAVVFADTSVLNVCDIIDLPGFGTGDRVEDDTMSLRAKKVADVLIYMSIANGFMRSEDIEYLKESIQNLVVIEDKAKNNLKPLSNLFIIASQAHTVSSGNKKELDHILDDGCARLTRTMPGNFWSNRKLISKHEYTKADLRSRFFTYTTDIENLRADFNNDFCEMIERLPKIIDEKAKLSVRSFAESVAVDLSKEIESFIQLSNEREKYINLLTEIRNNEPKRANDNQNRRKDLIDYIRLMKKESVQEFATEYNKVVSADNIVSIIKHHGFKKKKEDMQALASYLNSQLKAKLEDNLQNKSESINEKINLYISAYQKSIDYSNIPGITISMPPFDVERAFVSGLAGLATFGALAFWASTLGNLGAYILVAKGVSILSILGISVGGSAAAMATVAAIGGPVVLGIALGIIATLSIFAFFSGGWEKAVAKKIVSEYDKNNSLMKFKEVIEDYWNDTEGAFNAAADKLEEDWKRYVKELSDLINNYDIEDIKNKLEIAKDVKRFFENIPL